MESDYEDHDSQECRDCQMEAMAYYADILESDAAHSEVTGHDHVSGQIMADAVLFWTPGDDRWLGTITELVAARRQVAAMTARRPRFRFYRGRQRR